MKLLTHFMSADIRRFRVAIAIWLAIVVLERAIEACLPRSAGYLPTFRALTLASALLSLADVLLLVLLIPLVVHTHPLVGSDAFWMTRPIPPRTLLLSKLTLLSALFLLVPLVPDVVSMAIYHVPAGDVFAVAAQNTLWRSMVLLLLMCGAAITRNLARFAILGGAVLLGLAVFLATLSMIAFSRVDDDAFEAVGYLTVSGAAFPLWRGSDETAALVGSALLLTAGLTLLAVQYRSRSAARSVPVALGGIAAAWLIVSNWSWPLIQRIPTEPDWVRSSSALRLSADPKTVATERQTDAWPRPSRARLVRADVRLAGVDPGWYVTTRLARASLEVGKDIRLSSRGHGYPATLPVDASDDAQFDRIVKNLLAVAEVIRPSQPMPRETPIIFVIRTVDLVRYDDMTRNRQALARYRGEFVHDLWRVEVAATLPLERDAMFQEGAYRISIDEVVDRPDGPAIRVTSSNVATMLDAEPRPSYPLYLRNRHVGQAVAAAVQTLREPVLLPVFGISSPSHTSSSGFSAEASLVRLPQTYSPIAEPPRLNPGWLLGAELIVLRITPGASVRRKLEMDDVVLSEPPPVQLPVLQR